ncbi:MAG: response regulator [Deltaproteobacteria bacterium]|nr:response regulator [Deltaproteobacteria bacterium]
MKRAPARTATPPAAKTRRQKRPLDNLLALQESGAIYRALVEMTGTGYVILDTAGLVEDANAAYVRLTGRRSLEEVLGRSVVEWTAEHDRDRNAAEVRECFARGCVRHLEVDYVDAAGVRTPVEINATVVQTRRGPRILTLCRDISERRRYEDELQRAERLESIGVLAGGIAHDFNNILVGITGNISLAGLRLDEPDAVRELLAEAERAAFRARDLTQQLLTFARGGTPVRRAAAVQELIRESSAFVLRGSPVTARFDLPADLWPVEIDTGQISQVIQNIVLNAAQAMSDGGRILVAARNVEEGAEPAGRRRRGRLVRISISDRGPGIPPENLRRIFDPYFTTKEKGSGLGLAVAYSIVRRHDGEITVESDAAKGSTFHVFLPASKRGPANVASRADGRFAGRGRVLVMDDDDLARSVAVRLFRAIGFDAVPATDGDEAVGRFATAKKAGQPFDLAFLDLTVPGGMGGLECLARLRELDPSVRVIVSSGYAAAPVMADPARYGVAGVLAKPYRLEDIEALLHRL